MVKDIAYFSRIMPVPKADDLLDKAFRRTKRKVKDSEKISSFCSTLSSDLLKISLNFPNLDNLSDFYKQLVDYTVGVVKLKKALNNVHWASRKISQLCRQLKNKNAVFGRVSSIVNHISKDLSFLDNARKKFDSFPKIKDMFTVCITGFPNVGKTTLLSLITKSVPEIKPYAFTTKRLNSAYLSSNSVEVQFLDTPGTLNRKDKMNNIELQSFLAMKFASDLIVFVIDPTFDIQMQFELLKRILSFKKEVVVFISKSDIVDSSIVEDIKSKVSSLRNNYKNLISATSDGEELKKIVLNNAKEHYRRLLFE